MRKNGKLFKRLLVLFLVLVLCLQSEIFPMQVLAEENTEVAYEEGRSLSSTVTVGDINGDGHVNILDLQLLLRHISRRNLLTEELQLRASDINQDGRVDILDLRMLLQYVSRRISNLPAENTPDSSFINPGEIGSIYGNGIINRVQWLMLLTDAAYLDVATDYVRQMSSFADIDRNNPWFMDLFPTYKGEVEVALQNNVIVASAQNEYQFYPTLSATKSFAVVTAVRALGFYREEEHSLQDIFAIAVDIGLVTGTPTSDNLTENQANAILEVVRGIARPLDYGAPVVEIDFNEELIWLVEDEEVILDYQFDYVSETGSIHLDVEAGNVAVGDILILPPCEIYLGGFGQKVTGVYQQSDGTVIVSTEMPELEDLLAEDGRLYISGNFEGNLDNFVFNPNLQEELGSDWVIIDELAEGIGRSIAPASSSPFELRIGSTIGSSGRRNMYVGIRAKEESESLTSTLSVYAPSVRTRVDLRRGFLNAPVGINQFRVEVENKMTASVTGSISFIDIAGNNAIHLGTFPIPLGGGLTGNVGLFLEFSVSGSVSIEYRLESVVGFEIIDNHPRFIENANTTKSASISASARLGARGEVMLAWFGINLADVNARIGIGAYGRPTIQQNPPPQVCLDVGAYVFASIGALERGLISRLLNMRISVDIWNRNRSPFQQRWHFEDGILVERCTVSGCDGCCNGNSGGNPSGNIIELGITTAMICENGRLWKWGRNDLGQLGNGTNTNSNIPVHIIENAQSVSSNGSATAVVLTDGSLWTWGQNASGRLGCGLGTRNTPMQVLENVQSVVMGFGSSNHTAALQADGSLWLWGDNWWGQVGVSAPRYGRQIVHPRRILDNIESVSLGGQFSAAICTFGFLYTWGNNEHFRLGDGTGSNRFTPMPILDNVKSVTLGERHAAAIRTDGSLWMWGENRTGLLGDGTNTSRNRPTRILDNVQSVALGSSHTVVLRTDGSVWTWGANGVGQLGDGGSPYVNQHTPVHILDNIQEISASGDFSAAIHADGSMWMWGFNQSGQLGDGTNSHRNTPVRVLEDVQSMGLGAQHTAAIRTDGSVWMWGSNNQGQLGDGTNISSNIPVRVIFGTDID